MSASERTIESLSVEIAALRTVNDGLRLKNVDLEAIVCNTIAVYQGKLSDREKDLSELRSMLSQYAAKECLELQAKAKVAREPVPAAP